ncbi:ankyrin repeat-containing domain protein, partial [Mycotypha africana]|uniref:ankyrin repeat-containing domain protein n=1 Tax=Mycotypha africana TaxID=64632 RepID=UPI002300DE40
TPNLCDAQLKRSLLNWACLGQSTEAVKRLLTNAHLDINLRSGPRKTTALHEACSVGFSEGVTLLLAHPEVDINATTDDHQGLTPVHMAVQANQVECLRLLLAAGARVDLFACDTGRLPIHTAVLFGYQQCICRNNPEQLDLLWTPNKLDQRSAIEMAIVTGLTSTLQLLLDYDGHCSIPPSLPLTRPDLIDLAIEWNRIEMLRLLIKRGCKVSAKSLLKAVQQRKIDMVRELVTSGKVDPTATSTHTLSTTCSSGYNPSFLYAANHGFLDMIPLLLTLNTSKDCIQQALLLASSIGLRDQLAHTIVFTLKSLAAIAAKK